RAYAADCWQKVEACRRVEPQRRYQIKISAADAKALWRHADDGKNVVIQSKLLAQRGGAGLVVLAPERLAQHHHRSGGFGLFIVTETSARHRRDSQRRQKIRRDFQDFHLLRLALSGEGG